MCTKNTLDSRNCSVLTLYCLDFNPPSAPQLPCLTPGSLFYPGLVTYLLWVLPVKWDLLLLLQRFYLFIFREEGRDKERGRNTYVRERQLLVASCTPRNGGPGLQPRHVPQLGIKLVTLWFVG